MTAKRCHEKTGQKLEHCAAYAKAGLTVSQVRDQETVDRIGLSTQEDRALETYYRTPLPPIPDCSEDCEMCHPELYRARVYGK